MAPRFFWIRGLEIKYWVDISVREGGREENREGKRERGRDRERERSENNQEKSTLR
jgi:hypothetical protein